MKTIALLVLCLMCFFGGMLLMACAYAGKNVGKLRVDRSDPDGPYIFAEFSKGLSFISKQKYILMEVEDRDAIEEAGQTLRIK